MHFTNALCLFARNSSLKTTSCVNRFSKQKLKEEWPIPLFALAPFLIEHFCWMARSTFLMPLVCPSRDGSHKRKILIWLNKLYSYSWICQIILICYSNIARLYKIKSTDPTTKNTKTFRKIRYFLDKKIEYFFANLPFLETFVSDVRSNVVQDSNTCKSIIGLKLLLSILRKMKKIPQKLYASYPQPIFLRPRVSDEN